MKSYLLPRRLGRIVDQNNNFLKIQYNKIKTIYTNNNYILYKEYYKGIHNEDLKGSFCILHAKINSLFEHMNNKNYEGLGGHYNADESRGLLDIINTLRVLQHQLKDSPQSFKIDNYYESVLSHCKDFLSRSGGSSIPVDFPSINLIEHKPIFILQSITEVKRTAAQESFEIRPIGDGSYATVFKYKDHHYNQYFALKRAFKILSEKELERFRNEYEELKKLDSPHIIKVYNYNEQKNEYTMEYADQTLDKYISSNNNKLDIKRRLSLIAQIFKAFEYMHTKELLHRYISYHNILIKEYDDGTTIIKVSDFGLVKIKESTLTSKESSIKGYLNDPNLAIVGFDKYEVRHEIYALAQVIYFVLTGRKSSSGIQHKCEAVKNFFLKCLAPNIDDRYISVSDMRKSFGVIRTELFR